jgi:hypothetical protein
MLERFLFFLTKSKVIKLWRDFYQFYAIMKNINPPKGDIQSFHERKKGFSTLSQKFHIEFLIKFV